MQVDPALFGMWSALAGAIVSATLLACRADRK